MKTDSDMKTNYKVLFITFIISIFMALSLNSFSSSELYLPAMFLYFLSGLATFVDKIAFYQYLGYKTEERVSWLCFCTCALVVCLCIANSLNFIEITFKCDEGIYKVLIQGVQNSFFTFNSINITTYIFLFASIIPSFYLILCIISYLREHGITWNLILDILKNHKSVFTIYLVISILLGFVGMFVCYLKYIYSPHEYGRPQYHKYFLLFSTLFAVFSYIILFSYYRKQISVSNNSGEINPDSTIKA